MRRRPLIEKGKPVREVAGPCQQVEVIRGRTEGLDGAGWRKGLGRHQRRAPLVARMPVQVDQARRRKLTTKPGEPEVHAIELEDRPLWSGLNERANIGREVEV